MTGRLLILMTSIAGALLAKAALGGRGGWPMAAMLGVGAGAGLASFLFFLLRWAGMANGAVAWGAAAVMVGAGVGVWRRVKAEAGREAEPRRQGQGWIWAARAAVVLSLALLVMDAAAAYVASPEGEWDAFSIWNMRARFLAAPGQAWLGAMAPGMNAGLAGASHPGYPLLLSGWIAMAWMAGGAMETAVPATVSVLFALATAGLLFTGLRELRGEWSALLAVLVMLAPEAFRSQAGAQYSDIALSFYLLAWTVLTAVWLRDRSGAGILALAGLAAGLAPWTKNEGWPFALAAAAVACRLTRKGGVAAFLAGFVPPAGITLLFKTLAAPGGDGSYPATLGETMQRIGQFDRWAAVAGAYGRQGLEMGFAYAHPLLLLALICWALKPVAKHERGGVPWLALPALAMAGAEFLTLVATPADIAWHTATAVPRLLIQPWPALLVVIFRLLRRPEESLAFSTEPARGTRGEPRRRRAPGMASRLHD